MDAEKERCLIFIQEFVLQSLAQTLAYLTQNHIYLMIVLHFITYDYLHDHVRNRAHSKHVNITDPKNAVSMKALETINAL